MQNITQDLEIGFLATHISERGAQSRGPTSQSAVSLTIHLKLVKELSHQTQILVARNLRPVG